MDLSPQVSGLIQHQTEGFQNIGDEHKSTAIGHLQAIPAGIARSLKTPFGRGLGSTTNAAGKFGGQGDNTEIDFSDAFLSMGIVGGCLYLVIIGNVLSSAIRHWRRARSVTVFVVLALLLVMFGRWLSGGQYSTAALCWFCIGGMDRIIRTLSLVAGRVKQTHQISSARLNAQRRAISFTNSGVGLCASHG